VTDGRVFGENGVGALTFPAIYSIFIFISVFSVTKSPIGLSAVFLSSQTGQKRPKTRFSLMTLTKV
jgi:hypothetical protein